MVDVPEDFDDRIDRVRILNT